MAEKALPAFHSKAKADAEAQAESARVRQLEADDFLVAIDEMLAEKA